MNLAFYYHIPVYEKDGKTYLPGYIAVFIEGLAKYVEQLYLIAHTEEGVEDHELKKTNISIISLGPKTNSVHRAMFATQILQPVKEKLSSIDCFLIRCPSPLAHAFAHFRDRGKPVFYYIVGDYSKGADLMKPKSLRDWAIKFFLKWNHKSLMSKIKGDNVIVNSPELFKKIDTIANSTTIIPSTTLTEKDLWIEAGEAINEPIELLYTGRLDIQKGLRELVEATAMLKKEGKNVRLNLVGWEDNITKPVEKTLKELSKSLEIAEYVVFHGKKSIGEELNSLYRKSDIYCIPSYHEGFPRTIWEALANRLPVIATNVGGIPYFLENGKDAILINPKNVNDLYIAMCRVINDGELRERLIENGYNKAKGNIVDRRANELIKFIHENI